MELFRKHSSEVLPVYATLSLSWPQYSGIFPYQSTHRNILLGSLAQIKKNIGFKQINIFCGALAFTRTMYFKRG